MTLNLVMTVILDYFTEVRTFGVNYVTVVEVGPILYASDSESCCRQYRLLVYQRLLRKVPQVPRVDSGAKIRIMQDCTATSAKLFSNLTK